MAEEQDSYQDVAAYVQGQQEKALLRFITCGSVDDGKSTLIGRLLYDSKLLYEDQLAALEHESKNEGTQGGDLDFALLVDGLTAEREQGITIDVAYRFFSTDKRKFIVADTPGHEQYTRNMATGASTAEVAVILVDARHGIQTQTHRHSYIVSLLGIKKVIVAINKMDLVDFQESIYRRIRDEYMDFAQALEFQEIHCVPVSALRGDNVITKSPSTPWYDDLSMLELLETIDIDDADNEAAFRLPVQWVNRPDLDFRGFAGTVSSGQVHVGEDVVVLPSGKLSKVKRIVSGFDDVDSAETHDAISLVLEDEVDCSRGDVITAASVRCEVSDQFQASLLWMSESRLFPGRHYLFKSANTVVGGEVTDIRFKVNVNTLEHEPARDLLLNEVGICNISLDRPITFAPYAEDRTLGSFVVIDRISNETIGAGMLQFGLRRADNIHWQALDVDKRSRGRQKHQRPALLWFTGLSGAGKSTVANLVEKKLHALGKHTYVMDGDNVRHGLTKDLGFTEADRVENIRRVGEVSRLMVDAGLIVLSSFISPFRSERELARSLLDDGEFIEVFVDASLATCEERDPKGLYAKARAGELPNFTGVHSPYEAPNAAEVVLDCDNNDPETNAELVLTYLRDGDYLA